MTRDVIFRCQFHTTAVIEYRLEFKKNELDDASTGMFYTYGMLFISFYKRGSFTVSFILLW